MPALILPNTLRWLLVPAVRRVTCACCLTFLRQTLPRTIVPTGRYSLLLCPTALQYTKLPGRHAVVLKRNGRSLPTHLRCLNGQLCCHCHRRHSFSRYNAAAHHLRAAPPASLFSPYTSATSLTLALVCCIDTRFTNSRRTPHRFYMGVWLV